ncbi:MAG TPA: hypothetical protein VII11_04260, partial [Bacteroidota bacterium]
IKKKKNIVVQSNWVGKLAVAALTAYVFLATLDFAVLETLREITLWSSVVMMVLSFAVYAQRVFIGRRIRAEH